MYARSFAASLHTRERRSRNFEETRSFANSARGESAFVDDMKTELSSGRVHCSIRHFVSEIHCFRAAWHVERGDKACIEVISCYSILNERFCLSLHWRKAIIEKCTDAFPELKFEIAESIESTWKFFEIFAATLRFTNARRTLFQCISRKFIA